MKITESQLIQRAGHILMLSIWAESMMAKLLYLKRNNFDLTKLKENYANQIALYNKNGKFTKLVTDFKEEFKDLLEKKDKELLEEYQAMRDILGHAFVWNAINKPLIIHNPNGASRAKKAMIFKRLITTKELPEDNLIPLTFDEKQYSEFLNELNEIDQKIFQKIYIKFNLNPEAIR